MPAMIRKRLLIHTAFLFVLPILVAWFGLGVLTTIAVVLLFLLHLRSSLIIASTLPIAVLLACAVSWAMR